MTELCAVEVKAFHSRRVTGTGQGQHIAVNRVDTARFHSGTNSAGATRYRLLCRPA